MWHHHKCKTRVVVPLVLLGRLFGRLGGDGVGADGSVDLLVESLDVVGLDASLDVLAEVGLVLLWLVFRQSVHVGRNVAAVDVLAVHLRIQLLAVLAKPCKPLVAVRNVESSVKGTLTSSSPINHHSPFYT